MAYQFGPYTILGIIIIIINALPLVFRKPKFLVLTGAITLAMIFGFKFLGY